MTTVMTSKTDIKSKPTMSGMPDTLPPEYAQGDYIELGALETSPSASTESLPTYETINTTAAAAASSSSTSAIAATTGLNATHVYQIDTQGHPLISLPIPPKLHPIVVSTVLPTGEVGPAIYQSLREKRGSGTCALVHAGDDLAESPLSTTLYRFGPGRPPRIQLAGEVACDEVFEVASRCVGTRAATIRTHLGTFQWRYASRQERKAIGASNLLVLDQITTIALAGGKQEERRRRVAQLVRSDEFRTPGTKASTAGNGGRLMMDLTRWTDGKTEAKQMEVLAITTCINMLKREIDRRRAVQFMVIAGAAGS